LVNKVAGQRIGAPIMADFLSGLQGGEEEKRTIREIGDSAEGEGAAL